MKKTILKYIFYCQTRRNYQTPLSAIGLVVYMCMWVCMCGNVCMYIYMGVCIYGCVYV